MKVGYARVSTQDQKLELQTDELTLWAHLYRKENREDYRPART
jgi:DNA invertase Pin-like site-specific DNA recombinase